MQYSCKIKMAASVREFTKENVIHQVWLCGGTVGQASVSADVKGSLRTAIPPPLENRL